MFIVQCPGLSHVYVATRCDSYSSIYRKCMNLVKVYGDVEFEPLTIGCVIKGLYHLPIFAITKSLSHFEYQVNL